MLYRFWYSEKQKNIMQNNGSLFGLLDQLCAAYGISDDCCEHTNYIKLPINGELVEVEYTECSSSPDYWPSWDDTVYLGEAT